MTLLNPISVAEQQHIVLHDVSWDFYEQLLEEIGDRPLRVTFDQGDLEMMAPLPLHEKWKKNIGRLIDALCEELDMETEALGSTTFKREDLARGLEPDDCYYLQRAKQIEGKDVLDLSVDPAPDLAIEIDITRRSIARQPIYAALGVPELWVFDGLKLKVLALRNRSYQETDSSLMFPFLPMDQFEAYLLQMRYERWVTVTKQFRKWVRTLKR